MSFQNVYSSTFIKHKNLTVGEQTTLDSIKQRFKRIQNNEYESNNDRLDDLSTGRLLLDIENLLKMINTNK